MQNDKRHRELILSELQAFPRAAFSIELRVKDEPSIVSADEIGAWVDTWVAWVAWVAWRAFVPSRKLKFDAIAGYCPIDNRFAKRIRARHRRRHQHHDADGGRLV
jgi:hypothetical protein